MPLKLASQQHGQGVDVRRYVAIFEVEVLQSTGAKAVLARFGARPVSGGPNQPVDAADVRRRAVLWGASNEFAVCTAACVRLRWFAAGGARFASRAQQTRARSDQFE